MSAESYKSWRSVTTCAENAIKRATPREHIQPTGGVFLIVLSHPTDQWQKERSAGGVTGAQFVVATTLVG